MLASALIALLIQVPDTLPVFDSPATERLVQTAITVSGQVPDELADYAASVQTSMYLTLSADSMGGGDLPATVDELISEVRWHRTGSVHQEVQGHRARVLVPLPYTLATILERPWIVPHLYGVELYTPFAGRRAINPFGSSGPAYYHYAALDPVRLRVQGELVTLVPVSVQPRRIPTRDGPLLVVGTFYIDSDRGAVARARLGFMGGGSEVPATVAEIGTFVELENGLWEGRYWLPYQQRRDVTFESRLLGGSLTARVVSRWLSYDFNTGWEPSGRREQLTWSLRGSDAFEGWRPEPGEDAASYSSDDFADLRLATSVAGQGPDAGPDLAFHWDRASHLFRYNRVEGLYLGAGARLLPRDPRRNPWRAYGTAGWAFAEQTARGEIGARWGESVMRGGEGALPYGFGATAYRRLVDIQPFRPSYEWDWIYTFPAAIFGTDERDYYDATGVEVAATLRGGNWSGRLGARFERHDSVTVNTTRFLFGEAEEFGPLAGIEPGDQIALEASGGYTLGPGAFGMGSSLVARVNAEVGVADFDYTRLWAILSGRYRVGVVTAAARVDAGSAWGGAPAQRLFRFGSMEGLRGYANNEFGGSSAMLARGRTTIGLPPRSSQPLARFDVFMIPPLRPALVLLGETGWTRVSSEHEGALARLGAVPTEGFRSSVGIGVSIFDDALTLERLEPVGPGAEGQNGRWYAGLTYWY